jgi:hypothetical protein
MINTKMNKTTGMMPMTIRLEKDFPVVDFSKVINLPKPVQNL